MTDAVDFGEIEAVLEDILGQGISFQGMVAELVEGKRLFSPGTWMSLFLELVLEQFRANTGAIGYLCVLLLSGAVLGSFAKAFRNQQISNMGFYMIYLLMFLVLMKSFGICCDLTASVVGDLVDFMQVLMPAYLMAAAAGSYTASAVVYYEGFLLLICCLQKLVETFLLPGIQVYVLFAMLGELGEEPLFERGLQGFKKLLLFSLRAMIGVTAGLQLIQGMITPAVDEMKHTVFSKGVSSLGNIGNVAQNVTDLILGSGALLKNGIGAAASVVLISICLMPAVTVACYVVVYQVLAAIAEPVSDKRLVSVLSQMSDGMALLVKLLFTVCAMFLVTIAVICMTTGGIL